MILTLYIILYFHVCNVNIVGVYYLFNCYMFRPYDHLQANILVYLHRTYSTDNGSVVFRMSVNIMNNYSDRFIVSRSGSGFPSNATLV
jgi:hypothetical protein